MNKNLIKLLLGILTISLIATVGLVYAQEKNLYQIGPFENVSIKLGMKLQNNEQSLSNIKVAYDREGEVLVDDVIVEIDNKNPSKLLIIPSIQGWKPESSYYVIISKDIETTITKKLKNDRVIEIVTEPYEYKTISGVIKLGAEEKALTDINMLVSATSYDNFTTQYDAKVLIPEGESEAEYSIQLPINKSGYSLSYEVYRVDEVNELIEELYINPGYVSDSTITGEYEERKQFIIKDNMKQDIILPWNMIIRDKATEILEQIIKPGMTDYEKEVAIFKYIATNVEYDQAFISDTYTDKLWSSTIYLALIENKAVCYGYANMMKLLLSLSGIECDFVTCTYQNDNGHVWNRVKLDGKYYYVDATARDYRALNFTEEQLNYLYGAASQYIRSDKSCDSYDYNYRFRNYWIENNIEIGKTVKIQGAISLPKGQTAPAGGSTIKVVIGFDDRIMNAVFFDIPEGESSTQYSITTIPTEQPYDLKFIAMPDKQLQSSYMDILIKDNTRMDTTLN